MGGLWEMIILKLGGSAITNKALEFSVNHARLVNIVSQIKRAGVADFMVVHGGGSFGHVLADRYRIQHGRDPEVKEQAFGLGLTQMAMEDLNSEVINAFLELEIPVFPVQPSAFAVLSCGKISSFPIAAIRGLLNVGLVPVLYGVPAYDLKQGFGILSGDAIVPYLARKFKASRVILVSDVDGVYDCDPKSNPRARPIKILDEKAFNRISTESKRGWDVTGGMGRKLKELLRLSKSGIRSQIVSADGNGLYRALKGEKVGTLIK